MNFDKQLREKIKKETLEHVKKHFIFELNKKINHREPYWKEATYGAEELIWKYLEKNTKLTEKQCFQKIDKFLETISNENMNKIKEQIVLTDEEIVYLEYRALEHWNRSYKLDALEEILLRRAFFQFVSKELKRNDIINLLDYEMISSYPRMDYITRIVTGKIFKTKEEFEQKLNEQVEYGYNHAINCGGYAFEIDACIFQYSHDFEKAISELLDKLPFIRLLGDTTLGEDEYIVMYRWNKGGGHHFVKVQDDGTIIEKDDCKPVKKFNGWGRLENSPEAVFAVKKEHNMELEGETHHLTIDGKNGLNFKETVQDAIKRQVNVFKYHNHTYNFKRSEDGNVYICSNGRIVAEALIENDECLVKVLPEAEKYVSNTQPSTPLIAMFN